MENTETPDLGRISELLSACTYFALTLCTSSCMKQPGMHVVATSREV